MSDSHRRNAMKMSSVIALAASVESATVYPTNKTAVKMETVKPTAYA